MPFREYMRDEEGNIKHDKHGNAIQVKSFLVVRHNPRYIVK